MFKRFALLLGLATMGVGLYLIAIERAKDSACNAYQGRPASYGMSRECVHVVWIYFGGIGLIVVGLIAVLIGLASMRKFGDNRAPRHREHLTELQLWESGKRDGEPRH